MAELDVYRDWLEIEDEQRPLTHYALLKLKQFEDDVAKIRGNYRKLNKHVRKYSSGQYAKESQELLNELAKSMLCLTDQRRKTEYDASLGRKDRSSSKSKTVEELYLSRQVITTDQLTKAREYASAVGLEIGEALVQKKLVDQETVAQIYSEFVGVPYVDLSDLEFTSDAIDMLPAATARQNTCMSILVDDGQILVASPNIVPQNVEEELRAFHDMPVRSVLCTNAAIAPLVEQFYSKEKMEQEQKSGTFNKNLQKDSAGAGTKEVLSKADRAEKNKKQYAITAIVFVGCFMIYQFLIKPADQSIPSAMAFGTILGLTGITFGVIKVADL